MRAEGTAAADLTTAAVAFTLLRQTPASNSAKTFTDLPQAIKTSIFELLDKPVAISLINKECREIFLSAEASQLREAQSQLKLAPMKQEIQNICIKNQIEYLDRNPLLSLDYAAKQDVIVDVCKELWEKEFYKPEIVISLQANSPQVTSEVLKKGLDTFEKSKGKNGWKEIICINNNGEQNGAIRIMSYRSVFQRTLSTYVTTYTSELVDIHTKEDLESIKKLRM